MWESSHFRIILFSMFILLSLIIQCLVCLVDWDLDLIHFFSFLELGNFEEFAHNMSSCCFEYVGINCQLHSVSCLLCIRSSSPVLFQGYNSTCDSNSCWWFFGNVHCLITLSFVCLPFFSFYVHIFFLNGLMQGGQSYNC